MTDRSDACVVRAWERWHPFCCDGFSLPSNQLLAAKLLALYWVRYRLIHGFPPPFLPWVSILEAPVLAEIWSPLLLVVYLAATLSLCLNRAPRAAAAVCSAVILLQVLSGQNHYSNSTILTGLLLALLALQTRERGAWMIRAQLVLMYAGAAINKLLHVDWQSGQYIRFWTRDVMGIGWFTALAESIPDGWVYVALSWAVICAEASLAVAAAVPRFLPLAASMAVVFHVGMLLFSEGRISWVFAYTVPLGFLSLWRWPEPLRRPSLRMFETGLGRIVARLVWPGSEQSSEPELRPTPPWRWPAFYAGLLVAFYLARHFWRTAKESTPLIEWL